MPSRKPGPARCSPGASRRWAVPRANTRAPGCWPRRRRAPAPTSTRACRLRSSASSPPWGTSNTTSGPRLAPGESGPRGPCTCPCTRATLAMTGAGAGLAGGAGAGCCLWGSDAGLLLGALGAATGCGSQPTSAQHSVQHSPGVSAAQRPAARVPGLTVLSGHRRPTRPRPSAGLAAPARPPDRDWCCASGRLALPGTPTTA